MADSNDLFETIQNVINEEKYTMDFDLKTIMDAWINCPGYPILNVTRNYQTKKVEIKQERFLSHNAAIEYGCLNNNTWYIPINFATGMVPNFESTVPDFWLTNSSVETPVYVDSDQWILLNKQQTGTLM